MELELGNRASRCGCSAATPHRIHILDARLLLLVTSQLQFGALSSGRTADAASFRCFARRWRATLLLRRFVVIVVVIFFLFGWEVWE